MVGVEWFILSTDDTDDPIKIRLDSDDEFYPRKTRMDTDCCPASGLYW